MTHRHRAELVDRLGTAILGIIVTVLVLAGVAYVAGEVLDTLAAITATLNPGVPR